MSNNFYTYCLLKYKHSAFLDESINIGVLIYFSASQRFSFKYSKNLSRIKGIYNQVPEKTIKDYLRQIDNTLTRYYSVDENIFPLNDSNFKEFLSNCILPHDASVLQFSNFRTDNHDGFTEQFIENIIWDQYFIEDIKAPVHVSQEPKIIKQLYRELNNFGLKELNAKRNRFQEDFTLTSKRGTKFNFEFAWKNGLWNLVKPVGFDLKTSEGIIDKAHRHLGQFTDLQSEAIENEYKYNFIVGKPSTRKFYKTYDNAIDILSKIGNAEVIEETKLKDYSHHIIEELSKSI